jgi:hypothetical protein
MTAIVRLLPLDEEEELLDALPPPAFEPDLSLQPARRAIPKQHTPMNALFTICPP